MINKLKVTILSLLTLLCLNAVYQVGSEYIDLGPEVIESEVTASTLSKIKEVNYLVFANNITFMSDNAMFRNMYLMQQINNFINQYGSKTIPLLIESGGGSVVKMNEILVYVDKLKKQGYKFKCYVALAASAAFTFTIDACDKITLLENGKMMQHKAYLAPRDGSFKLLNVETEVLSMQMAKREFEKRIKNITFSEYYALTRDGADAKWFDVDELLEYNIIDEVL